MDIKGEIEIILKNKGSNYYFLIIEEPNSTF